MACAHSTEAGASGGHNDDAPARLSQRVNMDLAGAWKAIRTTSARTDPRRLEAGVEAVRSRVLGQAILVFILGFSVDDLAVLRLPGWMLGSSHALLVLTGGALWQGRRLARQARDDVEFERRAGAAKRQGTFLLLVTILVAVLWLMVFSAGVPPWAV